MLDVIGNWKSIRKYNGERVVPDGVLETIIKAGGRAPSWSNVQPWFFVVVREIEAKRKLREWALGQKIVESAPVCIVCCGDLAAFRTNNQEKHLRELVEARAINLNIQNIAVVLNNKMLTPALNGEEVILQRVKEQICYAIAFMVLEALNQGLGSCIIGASDIGMEREIKNLLCLPEDLVPLSIITLGYPLVAENIKPRPRKNVNDICCWFTGRDESGY